MELTIPHLLRGSTTESSLTQTQLEEEVPENIEETPQKWIQRHLSEWIYTEDSCIENLIAGDCSDLISFLLSEDVNRALFITIRKVRALPQEPVLVESSSTIKPELFAKKDKKDKKRRTRSESKRTKPSKNNAKSRSKSKSKSPAEKTGRNSTKTRSKGSVAGVKDTLGTPAIGNSTGIVSAPSVEAPKDVRDLMVSFAPPTSLLLEWFSADQIPYTDQFVFIVRKLTASQDSASLDDSYHIGYMRNTKNLKAAMKISESIFHNDFTFLMKLHILLTFNNIEEKRLPDEQIMQIFILDCITHCFCVDARNRTDSSDGRSVTLLLAPVITQYCNNTAAYDLNCLLLQLSFFDVDNLTEKTEITRCAVRLCRAVTHLGVLRYLFKELADDFVRKMFLYVLDLFSTILAQHITRKSNLLTSYSSHQEVGPICPIFQEFISKVKELSKDLYDSTEERAGIDRLAFSYRIVGALEDELDYSLEMSRNVNSEKRDMTMDRSHIQQANDVLKDLSEYLEENCLESAVESGNLDSLRQLARTMVSLNKRLERIISFMDST